MNKQDAIDMQQHGLRAIEELSDPLNIASDRCSREEFERIKIGVGLSLGKILMEIVEVLDQQYPEIDHLKEKALYSRRIHRPAKLGRRWPRGRESVTLK